ncbi:MAG: lytic transglycosylase domain-containing protein [Bryobacterales bacterium]|nr:lytic transglycosylase domain-containing protein [Bryobacterales bacterium]
MLRICLILAGFVLLFGSATVRAAVPEHPAAPRKVTTVRVDPETGRLVRVRPGATVKSVRTPVALQKSIAKARETARQTPDVDSTEIRGMIEDTARRHGVDPALIHSVVRVESNYQQKAISHKGAQGLMQLIPATAQRYGVANAFDPTQNLEGGVRYLKYLTERFDGDLRLALAAYNAGEGAVDRHQGIPPYQETQQYVTKVTRELQMRGSAVPALAESAPAGTEESLAATQKDLRPRPAPLRVYTDAEGRLYIETVSVQ